MNYCITEKVLVPSDHICTSLGLGVNVSCVTNIKIIPNISCIFPKGSSTFLELILKVNIF